MSAAATFMRRALLVAALAANTSSALATAISPVKFDIAALSRAAAVSLTNRANSPMTYDVRIYKWSGTGPDGAILAETTDVLVARPVITVPAAKTATIRLAVVARSPAPADYYRLIIDDITPGRDEASTRMRLSLPVQVINKAGARGQLEERAGELVNTGTAAVLISGIKQPDGKASGGARYLLPGERWTTTHKLTDIVWSSGIQ